MDIQAAVSTHMLATSLTGARSIVDHLQASPVPASAPASEHADAILQLSAAAQSLLSA